MTLRRVLLIAGILLILFLAMYSWNRRTRVLDDLASNVGLEVSAAVLSPLRAVQDVVTDFWTRYFDLVDVREENLRLKSRLEELESDMLAAGEDRAELKRLRQLVQFPVDVRWRPLAARVLAGKLGPNGVLDSITISRGYVTGARPGTPLVTNMGLVGRVLRSSAHASTVLLLTDPGSKVAVFGQESRAAGILKGTGTGGNLEVDFVQRDAGMKNGEVLVTSGLDNKYPKGLPAGRVVSVAPSDYTQFMAVEAKPLVDLRHLEEVLLLEKSGVELPPEAPEGPKPEFVGPPLPPQMAKHRQALADKNPALRNAAQANAQPAAAQKTANSQNAAPPAYSGQNLNIAPQATPPQKAQTPATGVQEGIAEQTPPANGAALPAPRPAQRRPGAHKPAPRYRIITP